MCWEEIKLWTKINRFMLTTFDGWGLLSPGQLNDDWGKSGRALLLSSTRIFLPTESEWSMSCAMWESFSLSQKRICSLLHVGLQQISLHSVSSSWLIAGSTHFVNEFFEKGFLCSSLACCKTSKSFSLSAVLFLSRASAKLTRVESSCVTSLNPCSFIEWALLNFSCFLRFFSSHERSIANMAKLFLIENFLISLKALRSTTIFHFWMGGWERARLYKLKNSQVVDSTQSQKRWSELPPRRHHSVVVELLPIHLLPTDSYQQKCSRQRAKEKSWVLIFSFPRVFRFRDERENAAV